VEQYNRVKVNYRKALEKIHIDTEAQTKTKTNKQWSDDDDDDDDDDNSYSILYYIMDKNNNNNNNIY
jgi:hypothetical protein